MALRKFRPLTPAQRFRTVASFAEITRSRPEPGLTQKLKKTGGRDNRGHTSAWLRGGGHPKKYRIIDFKRDKTGIPAKVETTESATLNTYELMNCDCLVLTEGGLKSLTERLSA